jgi:hypothetical protein
LVLASNRIWVSASAAISCWRSTSLSFGLASPLVAASSWLAKSPVALMVEAWATRAEMPR